MAWGLERPAGGRARGISAERFEIPLAGGGAHEKDVKWLLLRPIDREPFLKTDK